MTITFDNHMIAAILGKWGSYKTSKYLLGRLPKVAEPIILII